MTTKKLAKAVSITTPGQSETIIGRNYCPNDNSYAINISNPNKVSRLAGVQGTPGVIATIISTPFKVLIKNIVGDMVVLDFIVVSYEDEQHMVIFDRQRIDAEPMNDEWRIDHLGSIL